MYVCTYNFGVTGFLKQNQMALIINEKSDTFEYTEINNFSYSADIITKVKVFKTWEKICATYTIFEGFI